jgi:hypothetical protein
VWDQAEGQLREEGERTGDLGDRPENSFSQSAMLICDSSPRSWEVPWVDRQRSVFPEDISLEGERRVRSTRAGGGGQ